MGREQEKYTLLSGEDVLITPMSGTKARNIVLRIIDVVKPSNDMKPQDVVKSLVMPTDESFVIKTEKLIDEMLESCTLLQNDKGIKFNQGVTDMVFSCNIVSMIDLLLKVANLNGFFEVLEYLKEAQAMFQK